jgi:hypothetical protein
MSDWPFNPDAIPEDLPPSRILDLESIGPEVSEIDPAGTVVLLLSDSMNRQWAARAAIKLSAAWAARGRRIVLADLHLEEPLLGTDSGEPLEGIVDVLLYGASLSRIATPGAEGAYYLIPAGTYAPDLTEIYRHPRWKKLVAGFRDTQATLLLFLPLDSADIEALSAWSSEAILFGSSAEPAVAEELVSHGVKTLAVLTPTAEAAGQSAGRRTSAQPVEMAGAAVPLTAASKGADLDDALDLPPPRRRRPIERGRAYFALIALVIVVLVVSIFYLVVRLRPEFSPPPPDGEPSALSATTRTSTASREGELLNYSVNVKAFPSLSAAVEQLREERLKFPSTTYFISPEEIQGVVYFKILAGLTSDTLTASRLRETLVRAGSIEADDVAGSWSLLQATPLAFDLGEFPTREAAMLAADSLLTLGIPTYPVLVPYSDGSHSWQLYGGAYRDNYNAEQMERMLMEAGLPATITPRTGMPVVVTE